MKNGVTNEDEEDFKTLRTRDASDIWDKYDQQFINNKQ